MDFSHDSGENVQKNSLAKKLFEDSGFKPLDWKRVSSKGNSRLVKIIKFMSSGILGSKTFMWTNVTDYQHDPVMLLDRANLHGVINASGRCVEVAIGTYTPEGKPMIVRMLSSKDDYKGLILEGDTAIKYLQGDQKAA